MSWRYNIRDYDKAQIIIKKLNFKSILRPQKAKYNSSDTVKSSCPQSKDITEHKHNSKDVSAINDANLVPNKMYKVVLVDGQLMLTEHDEDEENVEQTDESNAEKNNSNVNENIIVKTKKKPAVSAPTVRLNKVDNQHVGPSTPNKPDTLKTLNLKSKVQDDKPKNISSETIKSCPQPKGIIFNYKIKKRATTENKPVTDDEHDNKPVREENHDKKHNISATDSADEQNNVSAIHDGNLVQNKMYKVVLVDGQLTLAEHDEDYIVEENTEQTNDSKEEIVGTDNCEKNNSSATENITESTKKKPIVSPPTVILNKVLDNNAGNTPKNIESYSLNMDSNENLVPNITISGPKNKMYATLDDLADAREGKAMVLLPLEKYTMLKTQLKDSQICEKTLRLQEEKLKIQINGYQMQQEYHMEEEAKLNDQIRKLKMNDEMNQKIIKEKLSKVLKHTESQTGPYMEKELKELETLRAFNTRMREIFNEAQIAVMMCCPKKVKECPWPDADKEKVLFLSQIISQPAYSFLKKKMNFPLPTWINVRRWMREKNIPVKSQNKVPTGEWPADTVIVTEQESAQTQDTSTISLQTHDERISINILPHDEPMHTIQPRDEHMHTMQPQDEHMHTTQPQDEHVHTIQPQDEYMHTTHYQNVETETTRAIHSIVEHQENEDANENLYSDYMQNDDIAFTEEVVHTEMTPTEVTHAEVTPTEMTPTEVTPTEVTPTEVTHTEVTHAEVTPTEVTHAEVTPTEVTHKEVKPKRVLHFLPRCRLCMISFLTEEQVREHVPSHYQNSWYTTYLDATKPYTCEFCNEVVRDRHHLIYHHRGHLGIDPLKCYYPGCNYSSSNTCNLISHLDRHKPATFKCEQCPALFRTFKALRAHRSSHSTRRSRRCALCRSVCLTDYTYQQHMLSHNKPPRIRCRWAECPERFYSRVQMRLHSNATHELQFRCPRCSAAFGFRKHLTKHLRQHDTRKVSHCVKCMKVFYDYGEFYAHWLQHKNNKEKCACGERFADKDKLAEHTLQCTFVPSKENKLEKRGRKRKFPEGDPNNIKPKRKKEPKKKQLDTTVIKKTTASVTPCKPNIIIQKQEKTTASVKPCQPNIIIQKQEIIKEAHVVQFKEVEISPDLQIVLEDNDDGKPGKIIKLKKVDALPANLRNKLIPLPQNCQQKVIALPTKNQQKVYAPKVKSETKVIALSASPQHNDITLPVNSQHTDIALPANPQYTDITPPANSQHTDIALPANPQYTDITLPANSQHTDIALPANPQYTDITLPPNSQHTVIALPANPQYTDITLPVNSQHTDITLPANPQHTDITLPANSQHTDITLPANPQHTDITLPANSQHNDITLPANPQLTDITLPAKPEHTDSTLLVTPQQPYITLPKNLQQPDIVVPTNSHHTNVTMSTNLQQSDNIDNTDITLPANPQQLDIILPTNLQQPDIILPSNPHHTEITLPTSPQHTDIALPTNPQHTDIIQLTNPPQQVSAILANTQQKIKALSENPQEKSLDLPANSQRKIQIKFKNPQQQVMALPVNTQRKIMALPVNTQQKLQFMPANPQQKVTVLPVNPKPSVTALPAHPQQRITTLPTNPQDRLTTLPANPQQKVTVLPVNPKPSVTALPAHPQQRITTLPTNPQDRLTTLPANPQQKVTVLPVNPKRSVSALPAHPQQRISTLPTNSQERLTTLPANPQQINIAVAANQQEKLISALEDHLIIKPRGSLEPNILNRSGSHHRHVPVTPVPEYNLQDMSAKGKQNATALQVKLESGSVIAAAPFSDKNQPKAIVSGTKGYYLNKLSVPHGSRAHKIVSVSSKNKISSEVLQDMTYVSEFVKTLKSDENEPKIESVVPKLKKVVPIGIKQKKVVLQTPRASSHQSVRIPQDVPAVRGFPQRDMPDLEL